MADVLELRTVLEPRGPAGAVVLTDDQVQSLSGGAKVLAVRVTVGGHTFDGRIARMGGENLVGFNKAVRAACGVELGDEIDVRIEADAAPRTVEVPDDLAAALDAAGVRAGYDALAPSHRKEYVRWITEAKKDETRAKRVAEAVERIAEGKARR